ncbi:outer membrane protein [Hyphomicrobium sp.]|uniref:outer membrane protein n=1 Tax=Hyphomicrobium sp. TaxID=82 RepID=UPI002D797013|nr:outer membrane protein [Hyphomicrobium sp.]HET6389655.1 outer membrane protein [Hyphomicrobium sp.]
MKSLSVASAFGGALLSLAASSGAWAADLGPYQSYTPPQPEVRYEAPLIWQGAYVGINGGFAWSDSNPTNAEGGFGGAQVGYNWQRGRLVFGIEGDFQGGDIGGRLGVDPEASLHSEINWFSTVRGRLGIATGPWLVYGTGGVAFADIDTRVRFDDGDSWKDSGTQVGYAVGGGIEWAFAQNWSAKAEYLFVGLGEDDFGVNNDLHTIRAGLNYKF